jgi:hypothetical protein
MMSNRTTLIRAAPFVGLFILIVAGVLVYSVLAPPAAIAVSGRTRGSPNAKVTLVEYGDFQ